MSSYIISLWKNHMNLYRDQAGDDMGLSQLYNLSDHLIWKGTVLENWYFDRYYHCSKWTQYQRTKDKNNIKSPTSQIFFLFKT